MKKIRITQEQAIMLENLNKKKVIKITESQYKNLIQNLNETNIDDRFNKAMPSELRPDFLANKKALSKGMHESLWESFISELYSVNESSEKMYESLIKLMEACGYVENRKLSKTKFEGDKKMAKDVILSGLAKLNEGASPFMAMEAMEESFQTAKKDPFFKSIVDSWFAKGNENVQVKKYYDNGEYWTAWKIARNLGDVGKAPQNPSDMEIVGGLKEIDGEEDLPNKMVPVSPEGEDEVDTITMNVPLFIRALEYSREDAQNDMDLHDIAQNAINLTKEYGMLSMDNYDEIFGSLENSDVESADSELNELEGDDMCNGTQRVIGAEILNYEPFKSLPETRAESDTRSAIVSLPYFEAGRTIVIYSKEDLFDHDVQGPKMVHRIGGWIDDFKREYGEEPIFCNIHVNNDRNKPNATVVNMPKRDSFNPTGHGPLDEEDIDEVTAMGGPNGVLGGDGVNKSSGGITYPVTPLGYKAKEIQEALNALKKKVETEEQIDEEGITGVGPYATPGFAPSKFMGTQGKKGGAPVNKGITHRKTMIPGSKFVEESAFDETLFDGGSFVKFDDCTKLNNNKKAQNGGCSTGAADGVVKLKQTASNISAPSLGKKQG